MSYEVNVPFVQPGEIGEVEEMVYDATYYLNYKGIYPDAQDIKEQIITESGEMLSDQQVAEALEFLVKTERVKVRK